MNHVAVLTGTRYGRIILTLERALGGETHAAVRGLDRILPLADGAIQALRRASREAREHVPLSKAIAETTERARRPPHPG